MATEQQKELLTRYVKGTCSPEEARQAAWLIRSNAFDQDLLDIIEHSMDAASGEPELSVSRRVALYNMIRQRTGLGNVSGFGWSWRAIAASIIVLVMAGGAWYYLSTSQSDSEPLAYAEITTGDERQIIAMPDSTLVWLNSHSSLKYTKDYNRKERRVLLQGEAFFKVRHDVSRPFIVSAGELTTRVLGTSFNVQAERTDEAIAVTLVEGKVAVNRVDTVSGDSQPLGVLSPDQQMIYYKATGHTTVHAVDAGELAVWKDGVLNLKDISFGEAVARIERWYNVQISVTNPAVRQCMVHASFRNEPLSKVLETLGRVAGFQYTLSGKKVTITGSGCPAK